MDMMTLFAQTIPQWLQAICNPIVLFLMLWQLKQVKAQMSQYDEQAKLQRSWEFIKFYQDTVFENDERVRLYQEGFNPHHEEKTTEAYQSHLHYFYEPRINVYTLLNHLISLQQVDEPTLFGYLQSDFNRFMEFGIAHYGTEEFKQKMAPQINLLLTTWATKIDTCNLIYGTEACAVTVG
jgi:hypothetical protein